MSELSKILSVYLNSEHWKEDAVSTLEYINHLIREKSLIWHLENEEYFIIEMHVFDAQMLDFYISSGLLLEGIKKELGRFLYVANVFSNFSSIKTFRLLRQALRETQAIYPSIETVCTHRLKFNNEFRTRKSKWALAQENQQLQGSSNTPTKTHPQASKCRLRDLS